MCYQMGLHTSTCRWVKGMNANLGEWDVLQLSLGLTDLEPRSSSCAEVHHPLPSARPKVGKASVLYHQASSCMKTPSHPYFAGDKLALLRVQAVCVQAPWARGLVNGSLKGNRESEGTCLTGLRFRKSQL